MELKEMTVAQLLVLHVEIYEELRARCIVRSANNPTGDLAEYLFCTAFGWKQAPKSERGYDAKDVDGVRYQIKGRRIDRRNPSRQLSAIRDLADGNFDVLAGVLFDHFFNVTRAALIPRTVVEKMSTFQQHTNSHIFMLKDDVWNVKGVTNVTEKIVAAIP